MKTIFDFAQFRAASYFLDTQCKFTVSSPLPRRSFVVVVADRMPVPLGDFISKHVYDSRLKSEHPITTHTCVRFVDVRKGVEDSAGSSWKVGFPRTSLVASGQSKLTSVYSKNMEEVRAVVNLVKKYYRDEKKVCIITPYDGQRAAIVAALKAANLPSANAYNVDSYQGTHLYSSSPYVRYSLSRSTN